MVLYIRLVNIHTKSIREKKKLRQPELTSFLNQLVTVYPYSKQSSNPEKQEDFFQDSPGDSFLRGGREFLSDVSVFCVRG